MLRSCASTSASSTSFPNYSDQSIEDRLFGLATHLHIWLPDDTAVERLLYQYGRLQKDLKEAAKREQENAMRQRSNPAMRPVVKKRRPR